MFEAPEWVFDFTILQLMELCLNSKQSALLITVPSIKEKNEHKMAVIVISSAKGQNMKLIH